MTCSVAKVDLTKLIRACTPFIAVEIGTLIIVTYWPGLVLFIPRLFGYR